MCSPAIGTQGLTKRYGDTTALSDLDLEVEHGEVLGYLGPNGAGKTTTIRLLLGMIHPTAGSSSIFGLDSQSKAVEAHRHVAYVPGEANLWPSLTGLETLHLLGQVQGHVHDSYRDELIRRFRFEVDRKVRTYSKGNRQKLLLIAGLMSKADLLVLDEPTSGLDPLMEQAFRQSIHEAKDNGQTVFLSSHILSEAEALCDRVAILRDGRLVDLGTLSELRHLASVAMEVTFDGAVPDVRGVEGVGSIQVEGQVLRCHVQGSVQPFLHALEASNVRELLSREPSLEELFLAHYGERATGEPAVASRQ